MSFGPASPVTGASQTGLTTPTYTLTADTPPNYHSAQYAITALGGTQTGVEAHSVSKPFTLTFERPAQLRTAGVPNPTTGVISNVPVNGYKLRARKGVAVDSAGDNLRIASIECKLNIPAGADVHDPESVRAMQSMLFGAAWADSTGIGDSTVDGIV